MAEQPALPQVHGLRMRVANLDQNGVPTPGADQLYISDAFTKVSIDPRYTDGGEIEQKNAQGVTCLHYKSSDTFKGLDIEIELCTVDPYLLAQLTGGAVLTDGSRTGFAAPALGAVGGDGVSIEVWTRRVDDGEEDVDSPWGWWVYPRVKNLRLGSFSHEDNPLNPTVVGQCYENPNWYDGPLNDWAPASDKVYQYLPTNQLPEAAVGYSATAAS